MSSHDAEHRNKHTYIGRLLFAAKNYVTNFQISNNLGENIATFLNLPNPESYTGQCWRSTCATFAADRGANIDQIMGITGHTTVSSVKKYVANSLVQKKKAAELTSLKGVEKRKFSTSFSSSSSVFQQDNSMPAAPININITLSGNAQMNNMSIFK
jgi:hypothetical protein